MLAWWILEPDHSVRPAKSASEAVKAFEQDRVVAKTRENDVEVSTVFLGMDHQFNNHGSPLLFETMVFGMVNDICERCSTWKEAEAQHQRICLQIFGHGAKIDDNA